MTKLLIACLMCLISDWCKAEYNSMETDNALESVPAVKKDYFNYWKNDKILNVNDLIVPNKEKKSVRESRAICKKKKKKHTKYIIPILIGWLVIKALLLPIVLKVLAVLSGKAIILSSMSLILAAIMGLRRLLPFGAALSAFTSGYSKYNNRQDYLNNNINQPDVNDSYDYYNEGQHGR